MIRELYIHCDAVKQKHILLLETTLLVWQNWETSGKHVSAANVSDNMFPLFLPGLEVKLCTLIYHNLKWGRQGGLKLPPPELFFSRFLPLLRRFSGLLVRVLPDFISCKILRNIANFSSFLPVLATWESRFLPSFHPPSVPLPPPILPGTRPLCPSI